MPLLKGTVREVDNENAPSAKQGKVQELGWDESGQEKQMQHPKSTLNDLDRTEIKILN